MNSMLPKAALRPVERQGLKRPLLVPARPEMRVLQVLQAQMPELQAGPRVRQALTRALQAVQQVVPQAGMLVLPQVPQVPQVLQRRSTSRR